MAGTYDSDTLGRLFTQIGTRLDRIERQVAAVSDHVGIPFDNPKEEVPEEVVALVRAGKKLEAIAKLRTLTGMGLDDARTIVETA